MNVERIVDWCEEIVHYYYVMDELEDVGLINDKSYDFIKKELVKCVNGLIHEIKSEETTINQ